MTWWYGFWFALIVLGAFGLLVTSRASLRDGMDHAGRAQLNRSSGIVIGLGTVILFLSLLLEKLLGWLL